MQSFENCAVKPGKIPCCFEYVVKFCQTCPLKSSKRNWYAFEYDVRREFF